MMMRRCRWICPLLCTLMAGCDGNYNSGDRVLVAKCLYESKIKPPERFDVVVFKYPEGPIEKNVPKNYIKRLMGLPGELIAIFFGQIFKMSPEPGAPMPAPQFADAGANPLNLWRKDAQPNSDEFLPQVKQWFSEGKFEPIRKPPAVMLATRRLVNDNNFQPADMMKLGFPSRWNPAKESGWTMTADRRTLSAAPTNDAAKVDWLTYRHLVRPAGPGPLRGNVELQPQLITDLMGYNSFDQESIAFRDRPHLVPFVDKPNWCGNLMIECNVNITRPGGEFWMELNRGESRFQAKFDLASGNCVLYRVSEDDRAVELGSASTSLRGTGSRLVRFANFNAQLTVWVDRELPFGDGKTYIPPELPQPDEQGKINFAEITTRSGPRPNDLARPASLGFKGTAATVTDLRLWRDTYYTSSASASDVELSREELSNPASWSAFQKIRLAAMYVHPGHYLCLGDNSTHSSDGRQWGLVPERLMLGRALAVYYPLNRFGLIR